MFCAIVFPLSLSLSLIVLFLLKKVNPIPVFTMSSIFFHAVSRVEATWDEKWRKVYLERSQNVLNVTFFRVTIIYGI